MLVLRIVREVPKSKGKNQKSITSNLLSFPFHILLNGIACHKEKSNLIPLPIDLFFLKLYYIPFPTVKFSMQQLC